MSGPSPDKSNTTVNNFLANLMYRADRDANCMLMQLYVPHLEITEKAVNSEAEKKRSV